MAVAELAQTGARRNQKAVEAAIGALAAKFGNRLVTSQAVREQHGNILTWIENQPPDAVVFPQSTADVQDAVRICGEHDVPVIAFGTGTSLEGHINAPQGGVTLDFRDMNRILSVHAEDLDCVRRTGRHPQAAQRISARPGPCSFRSIPGADASIGGMSATRASGTNAVRYGTMKDNVLALKVVLATGEVISTSRRAKKSAAGYDLTRLFVGSEGDARHYHRGDGAAARYPGGDFGRDPARFHQWMRPAKPRSPPSSRAFRSRASNCSTKCR
jgi:D-lactate dehydrogenase (cytochrome)